MGPGTRTWSEARRRRAASACSSRSTWTSRPAGCPRPARSPSPSRRPPGCPSRGRCTRGSDARRGCRAGSAASCGCRCWWRRRPARGLGRRTARVRPDCDWRPRWLVTLVARPVRAWVPRALWREVLLRPPSARLPAASPPPGHHHRLMRSPTYPVSKSLDPPCSHRSYPKTEERVSVRSDYTAHIGSGRRSIVAGCGAGCGGKGVGRDGCLAA